MPSKPRQATVLFLGKWPTNRLRPPIDVKTKDVFVTSTNAQNSLRDILYCSSALQFYKHNGYTLRLILQSGGTEDDIFLRGLKHSVDEFISCQNIEDVLSNIVPTCNTNVITIVIIPSCCASMKTNSESKPKMWAANGGITHNIAMRDAWDTVTQIYKKVPNTYAVGYHCVEYKQGLWNETTRSLIITPSNITSPLPSSLTTTLYIWTLLGNSINTKSILNIPSETNVATSFFENGETWKFVCRIQQMNGSQFEFMRNFSAHMHDELTENFEFNAPLWSVIDIETGENIIDTDWKQLEDREELQNILLKSMTDFVGWRNTSSNNKEHLFPQHDVDTTTPKDNTYDAEIIENGINNEYISNENKGDDTQHVPDVEDFLNHAEDELKKEIQLKTTENESTTSSSTHFLEWRAHLSELVMSEYGEKEHEMLHTTIHLLEDGMPYTIFISSYSIQIIYGALSPILLNHILKDLSKTTRQMSLPGIKGDSVFLQSRGKIHKISNMKIDTQTIIHMDRIFVYRCTEHIKLNTTRFHNTRPTKQTTRGSVKLYANRSMRARALDKR